MASIGLPVSHVYHDGESYRVEIVTFTPESAAVALGRNTKNRKLSKSTVEIYIGALKRGEWALNGETIIFGKSGKLLQGQHRLTAVVKSGIPMVSFVVSGVHDEQFKTLDGGKKRSISDVLDINGEKNVNVMGSAARAIVRITVGTLGRNLLTTAQLLEVCAGHPELPHWTHRFVTSGLKKFMPSAFAGVLTVMSERHGALKAEEFCEQVGSGVGLSKGMPSYVLREKFLGQVRGQSVQIDVSIAYCVKAANAFIRGQNINFLRLSADEAYPELV